MATRTNRKTGSFYWKSQPITLPRPESPIHQSCSRQAGQMTAFHPAHARKMAAKLQAMGYKACFYEPATGGHSAGKDNSERATLEALGSTFLRRSIGWDMNDSGPS